VIGDRNFASEFCMEKAPAYQRLTFDADSLNLAKLARLSECGEVISAA